MHFYSSECSIPRGFLVMSGWSNSGEDLRTSPFRLCDKGFVTVAALPVILGEKKKNYTHIINIDTCTAAGSLGFPFRDLSRLAELK